jgi:hypothetical protein
MLISEVIGTILTFKGMILQITIYIGFLWVILVNFVTGAEYRTDDNTIPAVCPEL